MGVFCYDVAEPFGHQYALALIQGHECDPRELAKRLVREQAAPHDPITPKQLAKKLIKRGAL